MLVETPVKGWTGKVGKDTFVNGICENASEDQRWYYSQGNYRIVDSDQEAEEEEADVAPGSDELKPPGKKALKAEWQEFLTSQGISFEQKATTAELQQLWDEHKV